MGGCAITTFTRALVDVNGNPISVGSPVGTQLTCEVAVVYSDIGLMRVSLFPVPAGLTGTATMVKEGPL